MGVATTLSPTQRHPHRRRTRTLIVVTPFALGVIWVLAIFAVEGLTNRSVVDTLRLTARIALVMFLAAFTVRPVRDLTRAPWARRLVPYRKYAGLSFALAMLFHLSLIATLFAINAPMPPPMIDGSDYVLGGPGFLCIAVLTVTSDSALHRRMGQSLWRFVHLVGITWIWTVFVMCFTLGAPARGEDTDSPYLWVPLGLCALAMVLRVASNVVNQVRGRRPGLEDLPVIAGVVGLYLFVAMRFG
jgi:DMSO/TMAO reductase YedYZ heme-binding membrane subunit